LQTLKAGVTAVRCYWQKTQKSLPFLASIAQQNGAAQAGHALAGSDSTVPDINGENVRLIAVLLTQVRTLPLLMTFSRVNQFHVAFSPAVCAAVRGQSEPECAPAGYTGGAGGAHPARRAAQAI
jgi:hypothetical protein